MTDANDQNNPQPPEPLELPFQSGTRGGRPQSLSMAAHGALRSNPAPGRPDLSDVVIGRLGSHQGEEGVEAGAVGFGGIKLESGGEQSCTAEESKSLPLAFSCLSLAFSCFSCSVSFLSSLVRFRCSIPRTGRQFSNCCAQACGYDKNDPKGDKDESDSPLLLEVDDVARE